MTQPQTLQQQVLDICQRAARTRTPGVTPREIQVCHKSIYGVYLELGFIKDQIHTLVTLGQLERTGHRVCEVGHTRAPVVRVPAALVVPF